MSDKRCEIRIDYVPEKVYTEIKNIAANEGIAMSQLLRPKLREIAHSYPEWMRKPPE